jgi:uncharacterized protein (DUF1786 family)
LSDRWRSLERRKVEEVSERFAGEDLSADDCEDDGHGGEMIPAVEARAFSSAPRAATKRSKTVQKSPWRALRTG